MNKTRARDTIIGAAGVAIDRGQFPKIWSEFEAAGHWELVEAWIVHGVAARAHDLAQHFNLPSEKVDELVKKYRKRRRKRR